MVFCVVVAQEDDVEVAEYDTKQRVNQYMRKYSFKVHNTISARTVNTDLRSHAIHGVFFSRGKICETFEIRRKRTSVFRFGAKGDDAFLISFFVIKHAGQTVCWSL